jgi:uncharacterized membrane protein YeaQ/YmgE (transglycosylase-associated protein family)
MRRRFAALREFARNLVNRNFDADDDARFDSEASRARETAMDIDLQTLIIWLLIGAIAGWLAGQIMKGGGFGLVGDIIVGIIGAFIAGELFPRLGFSLGGGILGAIIAAAIGACLLLFIIRLVKRA